ncbi:MAG TPA: dienelactone hydrolase family protein [Gemmatimonadales bacterium]|jgi:carboxymethylenebutenolidase
MRSGWASTGAIAAAGLLAGLLGGWKLATGVSRQMPTTHGEWVKFTNAGGDSIRAYVAYPERKDKAPGIIVIHEIFGLTDWEPTVADKLAGAGYVAVVPDLLSPRFGASPADPDSGRKLTALLAPDQVNGDLDAAYKYLGSLPSVRSDDIGTIGFCWGGGRSFGYATANPKLKAAVVCYGPPPDSTAIPRIGAKVLGVYGEDDARIDATLPDVDRQMKAAKKSYKYATYPGTGHGFLKPGRKGSDSPSVDKAWSDILGFYKDVLGK